MATLRSCGSRSLTRRSPSKRISPEVMVSSPTIIRRVEVLPQPEGPSRATNSPSRPPGRDPGPRGPRWRAAVDLVDACRLDLGHERSLHQVAPEAGRSREKARSRPRARPPRRGRRPLGRGQGGQLDPAALAPADPGGAQRLEQSTRASIGRRRAGSLAGPGRDVLGPDAQRHSAGRRRSSPGACGSATAKARSPPSAADRNRRRRRAGWPGPVDRRLAQMLGDEAGARPLENLAGAPDLHQTARAHDPDAVAQGQRLGIVVGDVERGHRRRSCSGGTASAARGGSWRPGG